MTPQHIDKLLAILVERSMVLENELLKAQQRIAELEAQLKEKPKK